MQHHTFLLLLLLIPLAAISQTEKHPTDPAIVTCSSSNGTFTATFYLRPQEVGGEYLDTPDGGIIFSADTRLPLHGQVSINVGETKSLALKPYDDGARLRIYAKSPTGETSIIPCLLSWSKSATGKAIPLEYTQGASWVTSENISSLNKAEGIWQFVIGCQVGIYDGRSFNTFVELQSAPYTISYQQDIWKDFHHHYLLRALGIQLRATKRKTAIIRELTHLTDRYPQLYQNFAYLDLLSALGLYQELHDRSLAYIRNHGGKYKNLYPYHSYYKHSLRYLGLPDEFASEPEPPTTYEPPPGPNLNPNVISCP